MDKEIKLSDLTKAELIAFINHCGCRVDRRELFYVRWMVLCEKARVSREESINLCKKSIELNGNPSMKLALLEQSQVAWKKAENIQKRADKLHNYHFG